MLSPPVGVVALSLLEVIMGTDIHMFVERRFGDKWKRVSDARGIVSPHYNEELSDHMKEILSKKRWHPGLHYALYGLLAGVRSKQFDAIVPPRGLPEKLSMGVKLQWEGRDEYSTHTPSYFMLDELLALKDKFVITTYFLNADQYVVYLKAGSVVNEEDPDSYYITCPNTSTLVSNAKMARIMNMSNMFDYNEFLTRVDQEVPYVKVSKAFWVDILDAMREIDPDPTKVRCVFWFED